MTEKSTALPDYGNWVPKKMIFTAGIIAMSLSALTIVLLSNAYGVLAVIAGSAALFFVGVFFYFLYAHHAFSPKGGNLQNRIYDLILDHIDFSNRGQIIDIGCGNGGLTIKMAKKYPEATLTGIDYWGGMWDYSERTCVENAKAEGVDTRTVFRQASASSLPFDDGIFDLAISNFVFHEVRDARNKKDVIKEALRVVKKGGNFVFQDLFQSRLYYGGIGDMVEEIRSWGTEKVVFVDTSKSDFIPKALKLPFMVGRIGIICGVK
ncbi:MAG TPA: class I SAM-dependent methyltransferase [Syntrophorhabdaceae bacterium]|nr:class I SAM-dependent methyltransferase [Syntrophorhabdaceae bacterium]